MFSKTAIALAAASLTLGLAFITPAKANYDNADWPSVHALATALKAKVMPAKVLTPNCPIVSIEP